MTLIPNNVKAFKPYIIVRDSLVILLLGVFLGYTSGRESQI